MGANGESHVHFSVWQMANHKKIYFMRYRLDWYGAAWNSGMLVHVVRGRGKAKKNLLFCFRRQQESRPPHARSWLV